MLKSRFHVIKHVKIYSKIGLTRKTRRYASKALFDEKNAARHLKAVFPPTQTAQSPGGRVPANKKRTEPRRFPREDFYGSTRKNGSCGEGTNVLPRSRPLPEAFLMRRGVPISVQAQGSSLVHFCQKG